MANSYIPPFRLDDGYVLDLYFLLFVTKQEKAFALKIADVMDKEDELNDMQNWNDGRKAEIYLRPDVFFVEY